MEFSCRTWWSMEPFFHISTIQDRSYSLCLSLSLSLSVSLSHTHTHTHTHTEEHQMRLVWRSIIIIIIIIILKLNIITTKNNHITPLPSSPLQWYQEYDRIIRRSTTKCNLIFFRLLKTVVRLMERFIEKRLKMCQLKCCQEVEVEIWDESGGWGEWEWKKLIVKVKIHCFLWIKGKNVDESEKGMNR